MITKQKHILVVEPQPEDAQIMREAFAAMPECGQFTVCRNSEEVKAYLAGAGVYSDRTAFPLPDAVLFSLESHDKLNLDLLQWIGASSNARMVILFNVSATLNDALSSANPVTVEKPKDVPGLKRLVKDLATLLCAS